MTEQETLVSKYYQALINGSTPIGERYQAIFYLKSFDSLESIQALIDAYPFVKESVLLAHEILYTLGQVSEAHFGLIKEFLIQRVED